MTLYVISIFTATVKMLVISLVESQDLPKVIIPVFSYKLMLPIPFSLGRMAVMASVTVAGIFPVLHVVGSNPGNDFKTNVLIL